MKKDQLIKLLKVALIATAIMLVFEIVFSLDVINNFFANLINSSTGWIVYVIIWLIMFLQVTVLNIPAYVILNASVAIGLVYGKAENITISDIGLPFLIYFLVVISAYMAGAILAYWLGRWFGVKAVKWCAGSEEDFNNWSNIINKKGKLWYFLTVLLPLFPDDLLCIVAGAVKFHFLPYCLMNTVGRSIGLITMLIVLIFIKDIGGGFPFMIIVWAVALVLELVFYLILKNKKDKKMRDKELKVKELRKMWRDFFESHNHKQIEGSSLIPENDGSVLFTTAGMQPLVPYLLGKEHPQGNRLFNIQRCLRTNDIESVGDASHFTFFEMLGNWSLNNYFKEEAIKNSFEFLTSEKYLGLPVEKLAVTVFAGNENAPRDEESAKLWEQAGMPKEKIFFLPDNWWSAGETGPCGPDTEMFYISDKPACGKDCNPSCDCGHYVEIGNNVFMEYVVKEAGQKPQKMERHNVDTGMGLERNVAALNGFKSAYEIDVMKGAIEVLESISNVKYENDESSVRAYRIVCDHLRASTFIMGDEHRINPSNIGQGYILRRLIRRAVTYCRSIETDLSLISKIVDYFVDYYADDYSILRVNHDVIIEELNKEVKKFNNTITQGLKEFNKAMQKVVNNVLDGETVFRLHDTFGFPMELTKELAEKQNVKIDEEGYRKSVKEHQNVSRANVDQVFKGGLSGHGEMETKYHTATHLCLAALREMYGPQVIQRGSNITPERMRLDFNLDRKMTDEEKQRLVERVNQKIKEAIPVVCESMSPEQAHNSGAMGIFESKYGEVVTVYTIGDFSKEICGGPHVKNTSELGEFVLLKEESSSSGVRRIKAILK